MAVARPVHQIAARRTAVGTAALVPIGWKMSRDLFLLYTTMSLFFGGLAIVVTRLAYDEWREHRRHRKDA